jgi:hypothetical protein
MTRGLRRNALATLAAVASALAVSGNAWAADSDMTAALRALSTSLTSHDNVRTTSGVVMSRDLQASYTATQSAPCVVTIHLDATATYTPPGGAVLTETTPGTFYTLPLETMSSSLSKANTKTSEQLPATNERRTAPAIYSYSGDIIVPLAGLKAADPTTVISTKPAPSDPTYASEAAAKAALAALTTAAAACAAPASK